jgi:hypothetical protein
VTISTEKKILVLQNDMTSETNMRLIGKFNAYTSVPSSLSLYG